MRHEERCIIIRRLPEVKEEIFLQLISSLPPRKDPYLIFMMYDGNELKYGITCINSKKEELVEIYHYLLQLIGLDIEIENDTIDFNREGHMVYCLERNISLESLMMRLTNVIIKTGSMIAVAFKKRDSLFSRGYWLSINVIFPEKKKEETYYMLTALAGEEDAWKLHKYKGIKTILSRLKSASPVAVARAIMPPTRSFPGFLIIRGNHNLPVEAMSGKGLVIGRLMYGTYEVGTLKIPERMLTQGVVIVGKVGYGKTSFVVNLLRELNKKGIPFFVIDMKGEYHEYFPDAKFFKPGSKNFPLKLNIFDEGKDTIENHVNFLLSMFRELAISADNAQLSPQMERLLRDALVDIMNQPLNKRTFSLLISLIEKKATSMLQKIPSILSSAAALSNRLFHFVSGVLRDIFSPISNISLGQLIDTPVIVDMSYLLPVGGKLGIKMLTYLMLRYIFSEALARGRIDKLRHITVIEDAHLIVPELFSRKSTSDTNVVEDMLMIERALGIGVILISTRPIISKNLLQNAGIKIYFRSDEREIIEKYPDIAILKVGEAAIFLPSEESPIKIKTFFLPRNKNQNIEPISFTTKRGKVIILDKPPPYPKKDTIYMVIADIPVIRKVKKNVFLVPKKFANRMLQHYQKHST